jgi:nitroreductase
MEIIKNLSWRYATKKFDATKKISSFELEKLKDAVQLSPSSFGLQAYKILIVENPNVREKLKEASWNQPQITESSHLFIFCNYTNLGSTEVDEFIKLKADTQNLIIDGLKPLGDYLKGRVGNLSEDQLKLWTSKQTYIAMANLLTAAAELGIDSCPMEGFEAEKYNEILGLKEKGLNASVIAALGYRSPDDQTQFAAKVRKPKQVLFEEI